MRLDVLDPADIHTRPVGPLHRQHLPFHARGPKAAPLAVRRDPQTANDRADPIAVGQCALQCLEEQDHVTFGGDQPVCLCAEGAGMVGAD